MHALSKQIEQLNATLIGADPSDVQLLADVHSKFEALQEAASATSGVSGSAMTSLTDITGRARKSLEQLILNEVASADAEMQRVMQSIADISSLLETGAVTEPAAAAPAAPVAVPAAPIVVAAVEAPAAPAQETMPVRNFAEDEIALLQEFITESTGHLETAEQEMLTLEDDPSNKSSMDSLFRAFHTIKGVAGFLDLRQMQALAHITEFLLDKGRKGEVMLTGTPAELVLAAIDTMKALVSAVQSAVTTSSPLATVTGVEQLVENLQAFLDGKTVNTVATPKPAAPKPQPVVNSTEAESTQPTPALATSAAPAAPESRAASDQAKGTDTKNAGDGTVKVATDRLDNLIDMVGELVIANSMVSQDLGGNS